MPTEKMEMADSSSEEETTQPTDKKQITLLPEDEERFGLLVNQFKEADDLGDAADVLDEINIFLKEAVERVEVEEKKQMELVDFHGERIHRYEMLDLQKLVEAINEGLEQLRKSDPDIKIRDVSLNRNVIFSVGVDNFVRKVWVSGEYIAGDLSQIDLFQKREVMFSVAGTLYAKEMKFPQVFKGSLMMSDVIEVDNISFPRVIGGTLGLGGVEKIDSGTTLPEIIEDGILNLKSLTHAAGVTLPKRVGLGINLDNLETAVGLNLDTWIGTSTNAGYLNLKGLESLEDLNLTLLQGTPTITVGDFAKREIQILSGRYPQFHFVT
jgi:hypothetical protein